MRTHHEALQAVETYSPAEELFNAKRRTVGLLLAPVVFIILFAVPLPIAGPAHRLAAILAVMVVLWITEALPLPITALLGPVLAVMLGVAPVRAAFAPFADPVIFVFVGSFMLAEAMFVHHVDQRIAYTALSSRLAGRSAGRILVVYGAVTAAISMWMSNTATTAMMYPIALSLAAHLARINVSGARQFALAAMLLTTFGATIGGLATPVGTPPNLIGIGMLERIAQEDIGFFQWMTVGFPAAAVLFLYAGVYFYFTGGRGVLLPAESTRVVRDELKRLGPLSRGERNVLLAFGITVVLWVTPGILALTNTDETPFARAYAQAIPESVAAVIGAILLFVLPTDWKARRFTLTWDQAIRIDWGVILLFGGGLAIGEMAFNTGLAEAIGKGVTSWIPEPGTVSLTLLFTAAAIVLSETTSNTASANMIVPIAIAVAVAAGVRPIEPALGATLGASMGFMMPVSTPTNAIVYSSGYVPITAMMRHGVTFDIVGFVVIVSAVLLLGPAVF